MSDRIYVRHPDLDGVRDVPARALAIMAAGGWVALDDSEVAAHLASLKADKARRLASLTGKPAAAPEVPKPGRGKRAPQEVTPEEEGTA